MKIISINKKAFHDYDILETIEAGIVLCGDEVKSIRANGLSLAEAFATVTRGEAQLINCFIAPYANAYTKKDTARQTRKLLLHRRQIIKLLGDVSRKGLTIIPLKTYFNERGLIKVELGIAKHRKAHDKKQMLKERDIARETAREIRSRS